MAAAVASDEAADAARVARDEELEDFSVSSEDEAADAAHATLDKAMMNELLLVCSNLGMLRVPAEGEAPVLMRGENCVEWVHDLQRAIRRDHAKHRLVVKQLGKWKILQKKLLPLLVNHQHDWSLVFSILKVLVMLTMKPPRDSVNVALQLKFLREYKHAFLKEGVIPILMAILVEPLAKKGSARASDDYLNMELVLTLIRNLLAIPNEDARFVTSSTSHLSHLQQDLIRVLHDENVYEMILLFAQDIDSAENREWNLLVMEMIDLTLTCSTPKAVAAFMKGQATTKTDDSTLVPPAAAQSSRQGSLVHALSTEKKLTQTRKPAASKRHSNFGGVMKVVGPTGRATVLTNLSKLGDDQVPQANKKPTARKRGGRGSSQPPITQTMDVIEIFAPKQSVDESDVVTMAVLQEVCDTILEKSYFQLTNSLKGEFRRGSSKLVSTDRLQYFHLVWFMTTYHRLKMQALKSSFRHDMKAYEKKKQALLEALDFHTPPPAEPKKPELNEKAVLSTLDMFSFNFVLQSIETYASVKNYHGMSVSVKLLTEMMAYLSELAGSDDVRFQRIADSLQHKIFYERDFLDRLPVLLKSWSPGIFSADYVFDVITLTHIVFKILDAQGTIKVLSRRKAYMDEKRRLKKQEKKGGSGDKDAEDSADDDDGSGDEEEAERRAQLLIEMQRKEADFDVRRYFQSILSFDTIKMYCHALTSYRTNSTKVNHYIHSFFYRAKHFRIHKDEEWTMQPMLYNIHVLLLFNKMLQDSHIEMQQEFRGFLEFIRGVVRDFFVLADKNRLLFVETLLRQPYAAKSCLLMQRNYEPLDSMAKSRAEAVALGRQEKLDRISEARRQKRALDAEDLDGEAEFTFTLNSSDFQSSSLVASSAGETRDEGRGENEDTDVGEAEFDVQNTSNSVAVKSGVSVSRSKAAVERAKNWTKIEDRFLRKVYFQYRHLPSVYEVISYEDMFQDRDRTPEQIERRVKCLKLHRMTEDASNEDESAEGEQATAMIDGELVHPSVNRNSTDTFEADEIEAPRLPKDDKYVNHETTFVKLTGRRRRLRRGVVAEEEDSDDDLFAAGPLSTRNAKVNRSPVADASGDLTHLGSGTEPMSLDTVVNEDSEQQTVNSRKRSRDESGQESSLSHTLVDADADSPEDSSLPPSKMARMDVSEVNGHNVSVADTQTIQEEEAEL